MAWLTIPSPWYYRKLKYINNTMATTLSNYQMKFTLHQGSGTDTATDVYLGGNANADLSDIRFTGTDGTTLLNYWFETNSGGVATVWVKVPIINQTGILSYIYIYYGNSSQASLSNGTNTFTFFDDFLGSSLNSYWNTGGTSTVTVANSVATISIPSGGSNYQWRGITRNISATLPSVLEVKYESDSLVNNNGIGYNIYSSPGNGVSLNPINMYGSNGYYNGNSGMGSPDYYISQPSNNTYFIGRVIGKSSSDFRNENYTTSYSLYNYSERNNWNAGLGGLYPTIGKTDTTSSSTITADWIRLRNYANPEPTWQIANAQETYLINLTVSSIPSIAEIYLNGGDTGKTTTDFFSLYPGIYDVTLKKAGYQDWWSGYFTIDPNNPSQQQFGYVITGNLIIAITATDITLDKTTCLGPCNVLVNITWHNPSSGTVTFEPAIVVDSVRTGSGLIISINAGQNYSYSFNVSLGIGTHTICPDPN